MEKDMTYLDKVKIKIEYDSTLSKVAESDIEKVKALLDKKYIIMKKNGFFAEKQINRINKKISKYINKKRT